MAMIAITFITIITLDIETPTPGLLRRLPKLAEQRGGSLVGQDLEAGHLEAQNARGMSSGMSSCRGASHGGYRGLT